MDVKEQDFYKQDKTHWIIEQTVKNINLKVKILVILQIFVKDIINLILKWIIFILKNKFINQKL